MNRHARRALEAKTRKSTQGVQGALQKLQGIEALPGAMANLKEALDGVNAMRDTLTRAMQDVDALQYRLDRQEYVFTKLVEGAYTNLGSTFGPRLNEHPPFVEWAARRKALEAEYDRTHMEAAPEKPATET